MLNFIVVSSSPEFSFFQHFFYVSSNSPQVTSVVSLFQFFPRPPSILLCILYFHLLSHLGLAAPYTEFFPNSIYQLSFHSLQFLHFTTVNAHESILQDQYEDNLVWPLIVFNCCVCFPVVKMYKNWFLLIKCFELSVISCGCMQRQFCLLVITFKLVIY